MKVITIQEQMDYLGATSLGQLKVINSEQKEFDKVEKAIDITWFKYKDSVRFQRPLPPSKEIETIESPYPKFENESVIIYETIGLCESNGIKFIFNKYEDNGFVLTAYTFIESHLHRGYS